jgi:hypothetical protein
MIVEKFLLSLVQMMFWKFCQIVAGGNAGAAWDGVATAILLTANFSQVIVF